MKELNGSVEIVQPIDDLPCSQGRIRYAHFIYAEELLKRHLLPETVGRQLCESYANIRQLFSEDAEAINAEHRLYVDYLKKGGKPKDHVRLALAKIGEEDSIEFHNFLADSQGNYGQNDKGKQ